MNANYSVDVYSSVLDYPELVYNDATVYTL